MLILCYSSFSGGTDTQNTETINIFSVASGHLYERLLRIMMLSLLKHTKVPSRSYIFEIKLLNFCLFCSRRSSFGSSRIICHRNLLTFCRIWPTNTILNTNWSSINGHVGCTNNRKSNVLFGATKSCS